jgi:hypothetical protein
MILAIDSGNAYAASKPVQITVIGGDEGQGGSHMGSFDAMYSGRKIEVVYSYNSNRANPIANPVKVFKGNQEIRDWDSYLHNSISSQKSTIKGKKIGLTGKWEDQNTFEAYKIYLPPDLKKIGER